MSNEYFKNVPQIGTLYLEEELLSFENIPIIFVCIDKNKSRYLCVCDDIIDEESWIIVKISNNELLDVINDECTVLSVYENKSVIVANKPFGKEINYVFTEYNDIDENDLSFNDQYLEMKEYLSDYIQLIENENLKYIQNNFEHYNFNFNLSHSQYYSKIFEDYQKDIIESIYNHQLNFEISCENEKCENTNEYKKDFINILYAA